GLSEASVLLRKIESFADPRLYALIQVAQNLARSQQPLVPQRVFMAGTNGHSSSGDGAAPSYGHADASGGLFGMLLSLLVAEKSGFSPSDGGESLDSLRAYADEVAREPIEGSTPQSEAVAAKN